MNRIFLLGATLCALTIFSCKKNDGDTQTTAANNQGIDPVTLSTSMKVGYGATALQGNMPAKTTAGPVLDSLYNNTVYYAISNRYIVIKPHVTSGDILGYYIQVTGANTYYKIDYTTAYNLRKKQSVDSVAAKVQGHSAAREGDNTDSSIVIKLPANLAGDTFSIRYEAYDYSNNVSNSINAVIKVAGTTDTTGSSALLGRWRYNRYRYSDGSYSTAQLYDTPYYAYKRYFECNDNKLSFYYYGSTDYYLTYQSYTDTKNDMIFGSNNAYSSEYNYTYSILNMDSSNCSSQVYTNTSYPSADYGGYVYDPKTQTLTIVTDEGGADYTGNLYVNTLKVLSLDANRLLINWSYLYQNDNDDIETDVEEYVKK